MPTPEQELRRQHREAKRKHPHAKVRHVNDLEILICPKCEHADVLDGWDVLGADAGCLFCNNCNTEVYVG